jgi:hypothetical protein
MEASLEMMHFGRLAFFRRLAQRRNQLENSFQIPPTPFAKRGREGIVEFEPQTHPL